MSRRQSRIRWRHYIDEENKQIYLVVHSAITAMGACKIAKEVYPGYECSYASDEYLDRLIAEGSEKREDK